jgi:hypothetical protein
MDLSFLRVLAAGHLPRPVPPGPAFQLAISYRDFGFINVEIPLPLKERSGGVSQPDAIVISITTAGWHALGLSTKTNG